MLRPVDAGEWTDALSNTDAEASLLGALLSANELVDVIGPLVSAQDFYEPVHAEIFAAVIARTAAGKVVNPVLLKPQFEGDERLKDVGGASYLIQLTGDDTGLLCADALAEQIRDLACRRRLRDGLRDTLTGAADLNESVAALLERARKAVEEVGAPADTGGDVFQTLDIAALEAMPPPAWLVEEVVSEDGLTVIYGEPGACKSFIALDMAMRLAHGMDWHGQASRRVGVLYIAAEGARGIGKRITGWKFRHGLNAPSVPFRVLPVAVQLLEPEHREKLIRTVKAAADAMEFHVGLVVLDTVSRSIAGADENKQETMTEFVRACDAVKNAAGGALIAVHHSGKNKELGMRGSSVLLGAVDAAIRISKSEHIVTFEIEKQKDAEQGRPMYFDLQKVSWGPNEAISTLVPMRTDARDESLAAGITSHQISQAFAILTDAWGDERPLSHRPETRKDGRYAPKILSARLGSDAEAWLLLLTSWLENNCLSFEVFDKRTKQRGLRVLRPL